MKLLSPAEVRSKKGINFGDAQLRRLSEKGRFPKPVKLSPGQQGRKMYVEEEIDRYLAELVAARDFRSE
jgi:predicted DNA-binding transcriptional regulator AlpA